MSATQVQLRRGSFSENVNFSGAPGELTLDTTNWRTILHDGIKMGGYTGADYNDIINYGNNNLVYLTGNQNISGIKRFLNIVSTDILSGINNNCVIDLGSRVIYTDGNQNVDFGEYTLKDIDGMDSMNWQDRILIDNLNGNPSFNWSNGYLNDTNNNITVIYLKSNQINDSNNKSSIDWSGRNLFNKSGNISLIWDNIDGGLMYSASGTILIDWIGCKLNDGSESRSVDWQNRLLYRNDNATTSLDWDGMILNDISGSPSIDWDGRQMLDNNTLLSFDYKNRGLYDASGIQNLNYNSRQLIQSWTIGSKQSEKLNFNGGANGRTGISSILTVPVSIPVYGGNTILMGSPSGFLDILVSGITVKIPYYK